MLLFYIISFFHTFARLQQKDTGGLAQLARACDWQSQGREFDSPNLHNDNETVMKLRNNCLFYLNTQSNTQKPN